ncbi:hypothetical protein [Thermosinus carboxydivorans]|uniref:hypothetical protein n=1 Tax=Thermosinus carboxydivorans TaxID=261685 RepID=UPI0002E6E632|nr:hypothetical protein [Thermosinus carboxydivorans]
MIMNRMQKYIIEALIGAFLLLFLFWAVGYWWNALGNAKFELKSCWDGVAALGAAGTLAAIKYIVDSVANSEQGKNPYEKGDN